ncbi:SHOCT domain-containing protein [Clostridium sp.]|uniref:SHOCT domain-containing protein n=1 Tax=Clostridium sp. TaxID=1506 RepID=UPI001A4EC196|nr:SHOCT domain-containing protein [Clostridium sp.]MBK5234420.1 SHOCT domain-containing protein [Clostridium sp.]
MKSLYKKWKIIKKIRQNKETYIREFNEGGKAFANIRCAFNANILVNNSGVLYNTAITSEYFFIRIENIKKVQVKTDVELSKQIIENKIPIIGDLSFPRQIHFFLIINYTENNLNVEKTIESKMSEVGAISILKARQQYIKDHPNVFLEKIEYTLESRTSNEDFKVMDIPSQINKLFELVEKGALSLEEFNQKKKELLSKM